MNWLQAIFIGAVQGLTEFLPVSSSGHLVLFQNMFGMDPNGTMAQSFDILLHLGTLIAVVVMLRKELASFFVRPFRELTLSIVIGTLPIVIATVLFGDFFEGAFAGQYLGFCFLFTAAIMFLTVRLKPGEVDMEKMGVFRPLIIGAMQAISILPGVSRSGSTIFGGLASGLKREDAAKFSFLLSVVAILGATVYKAKAFLGADSVIQQIGILPTLLAVAMAAVTGFLAMKFVLNLVKRGKLWYFGIYAAVLGILVLVDQFWTHVVFR
jgi:undecaprenyl-diphosphatase